jgi:bla regulator protein BlaR1
MKGAGQPFTQATIPTYSPAAQWTVSTSLIYFLPVFLTTLWLCGFLMVLGLWYVRWRRIAAVAREAVPLREGREVETLRRVERMQGLQKPIEIRLSSSSLEPGIFGIIRPVLVWPQGISARLEDSHLEAILAHELLHVRRRDNLAAAVHMPVEAIFWFYPLVWWLGARLLEERERACDEAVLESGGDRTVYAESILKICEFCVGSPMTCVSGVTGADLKKRIFHIMTEGITHNLDFSKKLLLAVAGLLVLATPIAFGLLHPTQTHARSRPQSSAANTIVYDTVSIKPSAPTETNREFLFGLGTFSATMTVRELIAAIYEVDDAQISGGPSWLTSEKFDVHGSMSQSTLDKLNALPEPQRNLERKHMLQALLTDHFRLQLEHQNEDLPIYSLVVAENGPKLKQAKPGDTYADGLKGPDGLPLGPRMMHIVIGGLTVQRLPMTEVAKLLTTQLDHTVLDHTGLTGDYDFTLNWTPDKTQPAGLRGPESNPLGPSIFTAIRQQLGLKLEPQKVQMDVIVIDHVEEPSGN